MICISNNILLLILPWICLSQLLVFHHSRLFYIHRRSWWAFWSGNLIILRTYTFQLRRLYCLRINILCRIWDYRRFWWNYLLRLCMMLINTQKILIIICFIALSFIKICNFWVLGMQALLNLWMLWVILVFIFCLSLSNKCLWLFIDRILTLFGWNIIRYILIYSSLILMLILL